MERNFRATLAHFWLFFLRCACGLRLAVVGMAGRLPMTTYCLPTVNSLTVTCGGGGQRDNRDVNDTLDRRPRVQDIADVRGWTRSADHLYVV